MVRAYESSSISFGGLGSGSSSCARDSEGSVLGSIEEHTPASGRSLRAVTSSSHASTASARYLHRLHQQSAWTKSGGNVGKRSIRSATMRSRTTVCRITGAATSLVRAGGKGLCNGCVVVLHPYNVSGATDSGDPRSSWFYHSEKATPTQDLICVTLGKTGSLYAPLFALICLM